MKDYTYVLYCMYSSNSLVCISEFKEILVTNQTCFNWLVYQQIISFSVLTSILIQKYILYLKPASASLFRTMIHLSLEPLPSANHQHYILKTIEPCHMYIYRVLSTVILEELYAHIFFVPKNVTISEFNQVV